MIWLIGWVVAGLAVTAWTGMWFWYLLGVALTGIGVWIGYREGFTDGADAVRARIVRGM